MKTIFTSALASLLVLGASAQQPENFENNDLSHVTASRGSIAISNKHRVSGEHALKWEFAPGDTLTINREIGFRPQGSTSRYILGKEYKELGETIGFCLPIYSPEEQDVKMRIAFGRENGIDCYTDVSLAYDHWFRFMMLYDRNQMKGAPRTDMNKLQLINLSNQSGTIYLDDLATSMAMDQRQLMLSHLMPANTFHVQRKALGETMNEENHLNRAWFPLTTPTEKELADLQLIEDRIFDIEWGGKKFVDKYNDAAIKKVRDRYNGYNISVENGCINGDHVTTNGKYNEFIREVALMHYKTRDLSQKKELATMGVNLLWHAADVANTKIAWYNGRGVADGAYLLREELHKRGLFDKVFNYVRSAYSFNALYDEDRVDGMEGMRGIGSDDLYTNSISKLLCAMMVENPQERVRDMRHLISYYNNVAFQYAPGLADTFKPDGSHYHHANVIADGYAYYTIHVVSEMFRILSNTSFTFSREAHELIRHNVKTREFYRNDKYFPWAYIHHGIRSTRIATPEEFLNMALCGTVDGTDHIDREMAAIYLRLMGEGKLPEEAKILVEEGIKPSAVPQGHKTMSYFAKCIHRWNDWMVVGGAHSRYLYPSENWKSRPNLPEAKANPFINWGQLELIKPNREGMPFVDNGWDVKGWDFTRIPGTTTVKAPLDSLKSIVLKNGDDEDEHLRSDQAFVGGVDASSGEGIFVAKLHGHEKYNLDSFYATKSYFMVGDMILCLGSEIQNQLPYYKTQTTLFQNAIEYNPFDLNINGRDAKDKHFTERLAKENNYLIDSRGVGYYIPHGNIEISYSLQHGRDVADTEDLEGEFETAWIDHGNAPDGAEYEYLIKLETDKKQMRNISRNAKETYKVIQKDKKAHSVYFPEQKTLAIALFEKNYDLNLGAIQGITHSSLVMAKEDGESLNLSIADPDLRFYEGPSSDVDLFGVRHEQPAYSHFWYNNESKPSTIKVFLNGDWQVDEIVQRNGKVVQRAGGITVVEFECQHGLSCEVKLSKIEK